MTIKPTAKTLKIEIPRDLDAATADAAHASLLVALERAESSGARVELSLGEEQSGCAPLSLQLLASAMRSFPDGTLSLDERGTSALATLTRPKES